VALGELGNVAPEIGQPPRDGDAEACGCRVVAAFEPGERLLELGLRRSQLGFAAPGLELEGDDLVVERRHEHLDVVVDDLADAQQHMLLRRQCGHACRRPRRSAREPVDKPVEVRSAERARGHASQELPSTQARQTFSRWILHSPST
jgi:hypothetical protein